MPAQWAALVIVLPLIGALLAILTDRRRRTKTTGPSSLPWLWAVLVSASSLFACVRLFQQVRASETQRIHYALGDWRTPWGIEYVVDPLNVSVLLVICSISLVVTLYSRRPVIAEIPHDRLGAFYSIWLLTITGLLGMTITGDAFNVYVMLEISSLTIYALVAMGKHRNRRALTATIYYLIYGSIGASFILISIGCLYMVTGTLNMADMAVQLRNLHDSTTVHIAFAFLVVGLSLKMALFPLHIWLPDAYGYAPSAVTALIAATSTKVALYLSIRFFYTVFGTTFSFGGYSSELLLTCGCLAILLGSLSAVRQVNLKKLLAYSSIAQIGYIVVGIASANETALAGSIVHIINHALTKGGMFMAVGAMVYRCDVTTVSDLGGLGRRMPWTMAAFVVGGLGLIGVPLTSGFVSKWYLVAGMLEQGLWPIAIVILLGSLLALYYVWRLVEMIYFSAPDSSRSIREAPLEMLIPIWVLIGASVYFGVDATFTAGLAERAAQMLIGS